MHDNFLTHFNHYLNNIIEFVLHINAYLLYEATKYPLFKPGWPTSCANDDIIKHAYSKGFTFNPFSKKKDEEFVTSIAWSELWYGFY